MKLFPLVIACAVMFVLTPAPAQGEVLDQGRYPFEFVVIDELNCAGEDGLAQGIYHQIVTTMPRGNLNIHISAQGTWTGLESGNELMWLDNINDVFPVSGENVVYNFVQRLRILTEGPGNDFFLRYNFHITIVGGEVTSYIDSFTTECTVD